jgi:hypothetical protein
MAHLAAHLLTAMGPIVTWTRADTVDEVAASWDGHHIVAENALMVFRRGAPFDTGGRTRNDIYVTTMQLDDDVARQIALTVPAPEHMRWRPFARVVSAPLKTWEEDAGFVHTIVVDTSKKI